jgi:hypothetical protein
VGFVASPLCFSLRNTYAVLIHYRTLEKELWYRLHSTRDSLHYGLDSSTPYSGHPFVKAHLHVEGPLLSFDPDAVTNENDYIKRSINGLSTAVQAG